MARHQIRWLAIASAAVLGVGTLLPARAQDPDDQKRGVARISLMNGEVSVRRGDSGEWVAGVINAPLLAEDRVSTGQNSRAEIQFDSGNILRLGGNGEVRITDLEANRYQVGIAKGTVTFRVLRVTGANVEIDTPSVSVRPSKIGTFRIAVSDAGESEVMSRAGDVEVFTPRGSQWINAGQMMVARGSAQDPEFQIVGGRPMDDWDRWNEDRDKYFTHSTSYQYVDPSTSGVYGTEDLDNNGVWTEVPNYGEVWRPTVTAGWAPYRAGRWVWEDWYGWTWVSDDPWGWAPYHYGRWFFDGSFGWCWYPGARGMRSYWSPAMVGWFGWGGGAGFGFGFGNVGWVPLAPFEAFHPWWGRGFRGGEFGRNMNIVNGNVSTIYRNARIGNGASGMGAAEFRAGRFNTVTHLSGEQMRSAGMVHGQMPISPSSANLRFADRGASFAPRSNENVHFYSHQQPTAAQRTPIGTTQRAATANGLGNTRPSSAVAAPRTEARGAVSSSPQAARPSQNGAASGGWHRFGEPAGGGTANAPRSSALENTRPAQAQGQTGGWQRFGSPSANAPRSNAPAPRSSNAPGYSAPQQRSAPSYSAPAQRSSPSYSAPAQRSSPSYSAPSRSSGGGGGSTRPSSSGGGGSSRGHR